MTSVCGTQQGKNTGQSPNPQLQKEYIQKRQESGT